MEEIFTHTNVTVDRESDAARQVDRQKCIKRGNRQLGGYGCGVVSNGSYHRLLGRASVGTQETDRQKCAYECGGNMQPQRAPSLTDIASIIRAVDQAYRAENSVAISYFFFFFFFCASEIKIFAREYRYF